MNYSRQDLREFGDNELSLVVFNDEGLYNLRNTKGFMCIVMGLYLVTDKQLNVLEDDLTDEDEG